MSSRLANVIFKEFNLWKSINFILKGKNNEERNTRSRNTIGA